MKHVPNTITIVRIFFAPVFIWMLLTAGSDLNSPLRWWGAALFIIGMATDGIDGYLARKYNVVSDFGKLLDPIADKVLTGGALITLSILSELPWWVTIVILVREVGITIFRLAVLSDHVIPASRGGKLKTIMQFVAISFALLPMQLFWGDAANIINIVLMSAATVLTVWTGVDYLVDAWKQSKKLRSASAE
ncbi:CDP-diacylglycerol--glycerol-3-phosphate 3-phosphatidyltransferase [Aurantimicrobium minutum]|uniref:CDP-diacylglycerol--glycerol-3-phosphate 3-phosphatidyltransferase n=1 Tax=Aurantimicrobium minutum TaxID=708131 RepID=UPI002475060B|nr:CDP-diacylglycerol--glycerol-3-phosphate 3-phosphatidyltransferase [Aurantimicrobium minutum]MDH6533158.1 CDP-diacylglycerol--glycerol-3-phosphate 3-phosphatidyltransferase [Aurantimicrobium minutum]